MFPGRSLNEVSGDKNTVRQQQVIMFLSIFLYEKCHGKSRSCIVKNHNSVDGNALMSSPPSLMKGHCMRFVKSQVIGGRLGVPTVCVCSHSLCIACNLAYDLILWKYLYMLLLILAASFYWILVLWEFCYK